MPWDKSDSSKHKKGLSSTGKKAWAEIADKARSSGYNDAAAIRIANSKAPRAKKSQHYSSNMRKYGPRKSSR